MHEIQQERNLTEKHPFLRMILQNRRQKVVLTRSSGAEGYQRDGDVRSNGTDWSVEPVETQRQ